MLIRTIALAAVCLFAASATAAEPLDNARVIVRDVAAGQPLALTGKLDAVVIDIAAEKVNFVPKGKAGGNAQGKSLVIELKDGAGSPVKNDTGFVEAFPRPDIKKVLENTRVTVWDYTWVAGKPTDMHFHSKDLVALFLADGALEAVSPTGEKGVTPNTNGGWRFQAAGRAHTEALNTGAARAIIVELN
jgi:hypothetical protein